MLQPGKAKRCNRDGSVRSIHYSPYRDTVIVHNKVVFIPASCSHLSLPGPGSTKDICLEERSTIVGVEVTYGHESETIISGTTGKAITTTVKMDETASLALLARVLRVGVVSAIAPGSGWNAKR